MSPSRSLDDLRDDADVDLPCSDHPHQALATVTRWLRCPHEHPDEHAAPLRLTGRVVACPSGHRFDLARHGYVSLLGGAGRRHRGDTTAMVAARERFLGSDHYRALRSTITALAAEHAPPGLELVVDLAGGTGHYLAPVLDARPPAWGVGLDLSTAAVRRAARAHPRVAALAADVHDPLPLTGGAAGVVLSVFGPRPAPEIDRVLSADGVVVVAHALPGHLDELRGRLGALGVEPEKARRFRAAFRRFEPVAEQTVTWRLALGRRDVESLVLMGPSAHHLDPDRLSAALRRLPEPLGVTAAVQVSVLRRLDGERTGGAAAPSGSVTLGHDPSL